jgi:hypothetical protein
MALTPPLVQLSPATPRDQWTVRGVYFDTAGWRLTSASETAMVWEGDVGGSMTLTKDAAPAGTDHPLDLVAVRGEHRARAAQGGGGLVSVEFVEIGDAMIALEVITKHPHGTGFGFDGRLVVDANRDRYMVQIAGDEARTGVREAMVQVVRMQRGEIDLLAMMSGPADASGGRAIPGMKLDPYDSAYDAEATYSVSDDPRIDELLPNHPLAVVRAGLQRARATWESARTAADAEGRRTALPVSSGPRVILSDGAARDLHDLAFEQRRTPASRFSPRMLIWPMAFLGLMSIAGGLTQHDGGSMVIGGALTIAALVIYRRWRPHP